MKPQWWVNCKPLAAEAIKVRIFFKLPIRHIFINLFFYLISQRSQAGELIIMPKTSEAEWYRWLETIQDWCISRQLWWGHRVPAYFVNIEGKEQDVRRCHPCELVTSAYRLTFFTPLDISHHSDLRLNPGSSAVPLKRQLSGQSKSRQALNSHWSRMRMYWIHGSHLAYGHFPPRVGRNRCVQCYGPRVSGADFPLRF